MKNKNVDDQRGCNAIFVTKDRQGVEGSKSK